MVRHMWAEGLSSLPSPSGGSLKYFPMMSMYGSSVGRLPSWNAYVSFTVIALKVLHQLTVLL